jgi:hypothetical protein
MPEVTAGAQIESDGNPHKPLVAENFNAAGDITGTKPEMSVQEAVKADQTMTSGYCDPLEDAGIYG